MRIHIVANSNSKQDQNIKYSVKDKVVTFLIEKLADVEDKNQAVEIILSALAEIEGIVNQLLFENQMDYKCSVAVKEEKIPTRVYDAFVLEEGIYDCLNIELGEGNGDNWWCVVFPAICFLSSKNCENLVYISKIWETINNVT